MTQSRAPQPLPPMLPSCWCYGNSRVASGPLSVSPPFCSDSGRAVSLRTAIVPDRRAVRRCTERAGAGSAPRTVGGCMLRGWPGIGHGTEK